MELRECSLDSCRSELGQRARLSVSILVSAVHIYIVTPGSRYKIIFGMIMDGALIISSSSPIRHWAEPNYIINQFKQSTFSADTHQTTSGESLSDPQKVCCHVVMIYFQLCDVDLRSGQHPIICGACWAAGDKYRQWSVHT